MTVLKNLKDRRDKRMNKRDFIFEGIRWWPVIKLVTLINVYSYLISLEIAVVG